MAKPQLLNSRGNWSLLGSSSSPGTGGQRAAVAVGDNKAVEDEQPPHSTASTWELLINPLAGVLAVLYVWILALRCWLVLPGREYLAACPRQGAEDE